jgi:NADPH:quinone reductase-like Zn-dependent oxidoreductase
MRAYEIVGPGGVDALTLRERDLPEPGPGEVRVRMRANAINYRDLTTIETPAGRGFDFPRVPNSDGAGDIVATGAGVTDLAVGDRVASCFFQNWTAGSISAEAMASALGGALDGVLADEVNLRAEGVIKVPDHLSYGEAACLPCAGLTAWNCLMVQGAMKAGDTILLLGTGGVSIFGLQLAAICGARAIITSSSDEKLARAKEMGAWATINYHDNPEWHLEVENLTGGRGVDIALETGGGGTLPRSIEAIRIGGTISLVGVLTGGEINPTAVMRKSIRLQGVYVGSRDMFRDMNAAIEANHMLPVIDREFTFGEAKNAYHAMRAAGHFGKIVINI